MVEEIYIKALSNSKHEIRNQVIEKILTISPESKLSFFHDCNVVCASDFSIMLTNKEGKDVNFDYFNVINDKEIRKEIIKVFGYDYAILFVERNDISLIKVKYELKKDEYKGKVFSPDEFYDGTLFSSIETNNKSYDEAVEIFGKVKVE